MAKNGLKELLIFATGVAIGAVVTFKVVSDRYENIMQDEIDSVKEVFKTNNQVTGSTTDEMKKETKQEPIKLNNTEYTEYNKIVRNYTNYFEEGEDQYKGIKQTIVEPIEPSEYHSDKPYVIHPDEFGALEDYQTISLTYYKDEHLADDMDELVEDIDDTVGLASLKTFGEYEEDCVFVRNDRLKCDYEICKDNRSYEEVVWRPPHQM